MNTETGEIKPWEELTEEEKKSREWKGPLTDEELKEMKAKIAKEAEKRAAKAKIGRNDPCPCGSGKKFKKCCLPVVGQRGADSLNEMKAAFEAAEGELVRRIREASEEVLKNTKEG